MYQGVNNFKRAKVDLKNNIKSYVQTILKCLYIQFGAFVEDDYDMLGVEQEFSSGFYMMCCVINTPTIGFK